MTPGEKVSTVPLDGSGVGIEARAEVRARC